MSARFDYEPQCWLTAGAVYFVRQVTHQWEVARVEADGTLLRAIVATKAEAWQKAVAFGLKPS